MGQVAAAFTAAATVIQLPACGNTVAPARTQAAPFAATDITGVHFGKGFTLTDHTGAVRSLADFKGKAVVVFFGYTNCPDVCPTTMAELAGAMEKLGDAAAHVQVLFVTLDPEHDSASVLERYLAGFDPRFLGLYGDERGTQEIVGEFKAYSQKLGDASGQHVIEHSGGVYIFDPRGQLRLHAKASGDGGAAIARDLNELLKAAA